MHDGAPAWPGGEMTQMRKAVCAQPCPWDEGEMHTVRNTIKLLGCPSLPTFPWQREGTQAYTHLPLWSIDFLRVRFTLFMFISTHADTSHLFSTTQQ